MEWRGPVEQSQDFARAMDGWTGYLDDLTYRAAGKEILSEMDNLEPGKPIDDSVFRKVALKYNLTTDKKNKLAMSLYESGAIQQKQLELKRQWEEDQRDQDLVTQSKTEANPNGDPLWLIKERKKKEIETVGDILKLRAKPNEFKLQEKGRTSMGYPISFDSSTGKEYVTIDGGLVMYNPGVHGQPQPIAPAVRITMPKENTYSSTSYVDSDGTPLVVDKYGNIQRAAVPAGVVPQAKPSPLSPEAAAKAQMVEQAVEYMPQLKKMFLGDGEKPVVNRGNIANAQARTPFTEGRQASSMILDAVEAKLRAESGAAVPEEEVKRMAKRFIPQVLDNDATVVMKLNNLDKYLRGSQSKIASGRPKVKQGKFKILKVE